LIAVSVYCADDGVVTFRFEERTNYGGRELLQVRFSALNTWDMCRIVWNKLIGRYRPELAEDFSIALFERE